MAPARARPSRRCGLSITAVLVAGALTLVVARSAGPVESPAVTRTVIDTLTRELRMATYDPTGAALPPSGPCCPGRSQGIVGARTDFLHFRQDLNGDGAITAPGEDLTYRLIDGEIHRIDGAGEPQALVANIPAGGLLFRYFDGANPPNELVPSGTPPALTACQRDCVARVRVTVHAEAPNAHAQRLEPLASEATSEVAIRNRSVATF